MLSKGIEALWSVSFESSLGMNGSGVVVFETGRLFGGDSAMIYVGDYRVENGQVHASAHVQTYAAVPGMAPAVGLDDFHLNVTGPAHSERMMLVGRVSEDQSRTMQMILVRRAELP